MSQLLIVTTEPGKAAREPFESALNLYYQLQGIKPVQSILSQNVCLAIFSSESGTGADIAWSGATWKAGIGAWIGPHEPPDIVKNPSLEGYEGIFNFAQGEKDSATLHLATDPIGSLHIYSVQWHDCVLIASSALVLAAVTGADFDGDSVREFLAYGSVFGERSLFTGIRKLPPGTYFTFSGKKDPIEHVYWQPVHAGYEKDDSASIDNFITALQEGILATVSSQQKSIMDLTGGFDSRILLAAALNTKRIESLDLTVTGREDSQDVVAAKNIAKHFHLALNREAACQEDTDQWWAVAKEALAFTDGEYDVLEFADILAVQRRDHGQHKDSINGSGGELIRGYWWELLWPHAGARGQFDYRKVASRRFAFSPWAEKLFAFERKHSLTEHFANLLEAELAGQDDWPNTALMDQIYIRLRMQRWQGRIASSTARTRTTLSPLLYRPVVDAALRASIGLRRNGRMARRVLDRMHPPLAALPMVDGAPASPVTLLNWWRHIPRYGVLARRVGHKIKQRLVHPTALIDQRLKELFLQPEVSELLNPETMHTSALFRQQALADFLAESAEGRVSARYLGRLLTLELTKRALHKAK